MMQFVASIDWVRDEVVCYCDGIESFRLGPFGSADDCVNALEVLKKTLCEAQAEFPHEVEYAEKFDPCLT